MKKNQIYIILLFIFISATQVFSQELVFGTQNFPPFSYTSNEGVAKGPGVQLIKAVCKEAQLKYAFKIGLWQGIQNRVKNKRSKINSLFFLGKNTKREKWLYFTPPIIQTEYGFFAKKDSRIRYTKNKKTKNRLSSYTIGVYGPSNTERVLKKLQKAGGGFAIKIFRDSGSTLKNLSFRNSLSMVFSNREVGMSIIDKNNYVEKKSAFRSPAINCDFI